MMELVLKTIIGPIVVGVVLRLVDKWLNEDSVKKTLVKLNKSNRNLSQTNGATIPHVTTQSIIAGVPLEQLSQALGHTKIYMTDRYNQVEDNSLKRLQTYYLVIFAKKSPTIPRPKSEKYRKISENYF